MAKKGDKKSNKKKETKEPSPPETTDPLLLYSNYVKECEHLNIPVYNGMKNALCNEENPNNGKQLILVGGDENDDGELHSSSTVNESQHDDSTTLGANGCKALMTAVLGKCHHQTQEECNGDDVPANQAIAPSGAETNSTIPKRNALVYGEFQDVRIMKSHIGDEGTIAISKVLRDDKSSIKYLELSRNNLGIRAAQILGRSLCIGVSDSLDDILHKT